MGLNLSTASAAKAVKKRILVICIKNGLNRPKFEFGGLNTHFLNKEVVICTGYEPINEGPLFCVSLHI